LPPAKGFKAQVKPEEKGKGDKRAGSLGRAGGGRTLSEKPDRIIKATIKSYQGCGEGIAESSQKLLQRYDRIYIPPIVPIITRVERYGCNCPHCGALQIAPLPVGMELGSPFGNRIAALVTTLRYSHGISYARMTQMLSEVFGLEMSQGAIAKLLSRVKGQLQSGGWDFSSA
jgi:transposase